jgi:CBS domain containing-hemolysin-like protein
MIGDLLALLLGVLVVAVIIAANGYFVAQEFAYMSVDRRKLSAQADAGDVSAKRALQVTRRTSFMLSGAQLGITVTGLMVGFVAEPLIGRSLGALVGVTGIPAAVSVTIGTVLALGASTVVQMIFGELFPKNYAIANPEPLAKGLARSTTVYLKAFGWLITVFDHAANLLLRALRIEPVHDVDTSATAQDLERIVADSRLSGDLPDELSFLLDRILDFPQRDVEHAMIPRSRVGTVRPETTIGELRGLMAKEHTRYPVIGDRDEPIGVAHLIDLLDVGVDDTAPVTEIMRAPTIVPTLMSLPHALTQLTHTRNELACVIDEYGGFVGVLTIEDLAEELVGELTDEHDEAETAVMREEGSNSWLVGGDVPLDEVERTLGLDLPRGDFETVAGLLIAKRGALPLLGETVRVALPIDPADLVRDDPIRRALDIDILTLDRLVPSEVRLRLKELHGSDLADNTEETAR